MALDIRSRAVSDTLTFQLVDADDTPLFDEEGKPAMCTIYGPGSKEYVRANQIKTDKLLAKAMKGRETRLSAEETTKANAEFLAAITQSIDLSYGELEGTKKLIAIYSDSSVGFIADQVQKKVSDWGNFKPQSKTNSSST